MGKIYKIYWAYRNKVTNKFFGTVHMPAIGEKKGDVLISYITEPFTMAPWEPFSNFHTNYWECFEIVRLYRERGYSCDIISTRNKNFIPRKHYAVCIDIEENLERLSKYLPIDCKKVFHILTMDWQSYNAAEKARLEALKFRRGVSLSPRRQINPSKNGETADYIVGFGNKAVFATFARFKKPIFFIPISSIIQFDFPENKNISETKNHFVWMGGGGAVLKGLDITLEAFSSMPDLHLHVLGPVYAEKDFVKEYKKELEQTPNIHVYGRIDVASQQFADILSKCSAIVYPSAGEGTSGTIIIGMHAGLIPIVSPETGIPDDSGYISLVGSTPELVIKTVREFIRMPNEKMREFSIKIWNWVRKHHTKETFSNTYAQFIDDILKI